MATLTQLGDLQLAILQVLWERGEATVSEVHQALLDERGLAPTTIATMLTKMEKRGMVAHREEGRRFVYRPEMSEAKVQRSMLRELTARVFEGDVTALVSRLLDNEEIDRDELAAIRRMIEEHAKTQGK
ncbi:MAG TPA: BlaI/MecI/CopY family transcriptional regulator [Thermoanaerobaculia bacterium]|nr:BlaI/MecI/CopY family transcriptional regulator [Thermoanaerobaculia bacterium]